MAGFWNDVVYGDNVDFSGAFPPSPTVLADGDLLIGSAVAPKIRVGPLLAGAGISIVNGPGTITIAATGTPSSLTFTDVAVPTLATPFTGWYVTAATTITLPAGAAQGDLVVVVADTASPVVVQANAGQSMRIGNNISSVGGTATSTARGNSVTYYFRAATSTWISTSTEGGWNLV